MEPSTSYTSFSPQQYTSTDSPQLPYPFSDPPLDLEGITYVLLDPPKEEIEAVCGLFNQRPPEGYEITGVKKIYSTSRWSAFLSFAKAIQNKYKGCHASFNPSQQDESDEDRKLRTQVWKLFEETVSCFSCQEYPSLSISAVWHGTPERNVKPIVEEGYKFTGGTDPGYFGKGIYFAKEAAYAALYAKDGVMLLNWVATHAVYPVTEKDRTTLQGGACYKNCDAHFVPVVPVNPLLPTEKVYYGLVPDRTYCYREFVIFQTSAALPCYVVTIGKIFKKNLTPYNTVFQLFQRLHYQPKLTASEAQRDPKNQIRLAWNRLVGQGSSGASSSTSSQEDTYVDLRASSRELFEKILCLLLSPYASENIEPQLSQLLDHLVRKYFLERNRGLLRNALDLFYHASSLNFEKLDKINWLVLFPLQFALPLNGKIDLLDQAFEGCFSAIESGVDKRPFLPLMKYLAETLVEFSDFGEVKKYYQRLFYHPMLRKEFVKTLEHLNYKDIKELASLPDMSGYRFSFTQDQENFFGSLVSITDSYPHKRPDLPQVKMSFFFEGNKCEGYLNPRVIEQLQLDAHGNIGRFYKDASHAVAPVSLGGTQLHFKQYPLNPWMEYAVYCLMHRVAGPLSPATKLVRLEVVRGSSLKVFPVQVSRTVEGQTLKDQLGLESWDQLEDSQKARWTWLFLCSILTAPGDGRNSNYVIDFQGAIFCIDNEISFVEPVLSTVLGKTVAFGAAPFCYFDEAVLDRKTLEEFAGLDVQAILGGWIGDLMDEEKTNGDSRERALFSPSEIKQFKATYVYKRHLLFREGAIAKLHLQFSLLQKFIKEALHKNEKIVALDLLKLIVSLQASTTAKSYVGGYIYQQYQKSFNKKRALRLNSVLDRSISLTQQDADKAHYGTVLTQEKVAGAKQYRLAKAKEELFIKESNTLNNFKDISKERQSELLKSLQIAFEGDKPSSLSLMHASQLTEEILEPFLHEYLKNLDLSYCVKLREGWLKLIETCCPNLEELSVTGCVGLKALAHVTGAFGNTIEVLKFSHVKVFTARDCPNLKVVRLSLPLLQTFCASNNPSLSEFNLECPRHNPDSPDVDLRDCPNLTSKIQSSYKRTALRMLDQSVLSLEQLPSDLKKDREIVRRAVSKDPENLKFADESLGTDQDFVLSLVNELAFALKYVDHSLRKHRGFIAAAVFQNPFAFRYVDESLATDHNFILSLIKQLPSILNYVEVGLIRNRQFITAAVLENPLAITYADESLRKDQGFILSLVKQCPSVFEYVDASLKTNVDIVLAAISQDAKAIVYADPSLKQNRRFVIDAVAKNGFVFDYIDNSLKEDPEILLQAVRKVYKL